MKRPNSDELHIRSLVRGLLRERFRNEDRNKRYSITHALFEDATSPGAVEAQDEEVEQKVLLVLYGPPAAGKGAAKKLAVNLAGLEQKEGEDDFKGFLKKLKKADPERYATFYQEEDKAMTSATTEGLPAAVFADIHQAADGKNKDVFESELGQHFHVNENGKQSNLSEILSWNTYQQLLDDYNGDGDAALKAFVDHPETQSWFAQARGWSRAVGDFELNDFTGVSDEPNLTLGFRYYASEKFLSDVEKDLESFLSGAAEETAANIYLADQSGESSANIDRINDIGKLKEKYPNLKVVGAYIWQPQDRTKIANLHRKAFDSGGRRVASSEVDRIYKTAPEVEVEGDSVDVTKEGPAIDAMQAAGFDSIFVFAPPNAFDPDEETDSGGRHVGSAICEPFGDGTGHFDIDGCEDFADGSKVDAQQYAGMEKKAVKKADSSTQAGYDLGDEEAGFIPEFGKMNKTEKKAIIQALRDMGFDIERQDQLRTYLKKYSPAGARGSGEFGKNTYSKVLFAKETNPTAKSDDLAQTKEKKEESARSQKQKDDLIVERWQKLAGLLD